MNALDLETEVERGSRLLEGNPKVSRRSPYGVDLNQVTEFLSSMTSPIKKQWKAIKLSHAINGLRIPQEYFSYDGENEGGGVLTWINKKLGNRLTRFAYALPLGVVAAVGGCAPVTVVEPSAGIAEFGISREEEAFLSKLRSAPKGKVSLIYFPEIIAGVDKSFPTMHRDAEQHEDPIGIDYLVNTQFPWTPIPAAAPGTVWIAEFHQDYGYYVVIQHYGGHHTINAHLRPTLLVKKGDRVDRGTIIGFGGNSGNFAKGRTGDKKALFHFHFGTTQPTYNFSKLPSDWVQIINPHLYAEKGRLGIWEGNDLDTNYVSGDKRLFSYFNSLIEKLPIPISDGINRNTYGGLQVAFLSELLNKGILQKYVDDDPREIEQRITMRKSQRPVYTLFVNPKKPDLYNIIIH